ncbi:MAG: hypothetical protein BWZ04_02166 [Firmicutes bacterium ADurb.BinA205]|nr:MAG: hypothetical protein BWZ04_02166 [Firmicutes bacterium ADurb.BinA205]
MDVIKLAEDIIGGYRIKRSDDTVFFSLPTLNSFAMVLI